MNHSMILLLLLFLLLLFPSSAVPTSAVSSSAVPTSYSAAAILPTFASTATLSPQTVDDAAAVAADVDTHRYTQSIDAIHAQMSKSSGHEDLSKVRQISYQRYLLL